jgi:dolichol-phosphate mannosyltransferase
MIFFLIPIYNEGPNLSRLCGDLLDALPGEAKHFIFVDDCSTDNSLEVIRQSISADRLTTLSNPINSGPGACFSLGFEHLMTRTLSADDRVITLEGDNTCDLTLLPLMNALTREWKFELVLASVYAQGGGFSKTSLSRVVISFIANTLLRSVFGIKVNTLSSFYRIYSATLLQRVKERYGNMVEEAGFICAFELLIKSISVNARVIEVPMILNSDQRIGKSKMKLIRTTVSYLRFFIRNWRRY